jgi:hypothetical protein
MRIVFLDLTFLLLAVLPQHLRALKKVTDLEQELQSKKENNVTNEEVTNILRSHDDTKAVRNPLSTQRTIHLTGWQIAEHTFVGF